MFCRFGSEMRGKGLNGTSPGPGHYNIKSTIGDVPKYAYSNLPMKIHL